MNTPVQAPTPTETEPSDEALMAGLVQRKSQSLSLLYERYAGVLKGVVLRVVHDDAEADDVLQEIFLQAWWRAGTYSREKGKPLGWLVTLARRRAIDRMRQRSAYRRATDRYECECSQPHEEQERTCLDDEVFHHELRDLLRRQLNALPPFQRQAIDLAFFKGMSQREIAASTHLPLGTVKTRIELGMRKLADAVRADREKIV